MDMLGGVVLSRSGSVDDPRNESEPNTDVEAFSALELEFFAVGEQLEREWDADGAADSLC